MNPDSDRERGEMTEWCDYEWTGEDRQLPLAWNRAAAQSIDDAVEQHERQPTRPLVYCTTDWLDPKHPAKWLADLLALIASTPHLDWLLLSKQPELWKERMESARELMLDDFAAKHWRDTACGFVMRWVEGKSPANVWPGTPVECQQQADERIPELLKIPAKVRFLSCDPLLEMVSLDDGLYLPSDAIHGEIHWVTCCGGDRAMHPDWVRSLRDQCCATSIPYFFKGWGEWRPAVFDGIGEEEFDSEEPGERMVRVGKKAAGHLLDGREHMEFPS